VASIYDVAVSDVQPDEAGGQRLLERSPAPPAAIGSAVVTTNYFDSLPDSAARAVRLSITVVAAIAFSCLALVRLMPRNAAPEPDNTLDPAGAGQG